MPRKLLELPLELLLQITDLLPLRTLLKFSETSKQARFLANSNVKTLFLGIRPIRRSSSTNTSSVTRSGQPWRPASAPVSRKAASNAQHNESSDGLEPDSNPQAINSDSGVWVRIPDAHQYENPSLVNFHHALVNSIISRHGARLNTLHLSIWALTPSIAKAVAQLPVLRNLSIRIEDDMRATPRPYIAVQRTEEAEAWTLLESTALWKPFLRSFAVENGQLGAAQLGGILQSSRNCHTLRLTNCKQIGKALWTFLGEDWVGRAALQHLSIAECGDVLDNAALTAIGGLNGLQCLGLSGCSGVDGHTLMQWKRDVWNIPQVIVPAAVHHEGGLILEVDPAYEEDGEDEDREEEFQHVYNSIRRTRRGAGTAVAYS